MKKAEFYINIIGGKDIKEYPKVNGWTEEIKDSKGNKITVGYDKRDGDYWIATEILTGIKCNTLCCRTRAECIENVHNNIDMIVETMKSKLNTNYVTEYIKPFRDFVSNI